MITASGNGAVFDVPKEQADALATLDASLLPNNFTIKFPTTLPALQSRERDEFRSGDRYGDRSGSRYGERSGSRSSYGRGREDSYSPRRGRSWDNEDGAQAEGQETGEEGSGERVGRGSFRSSGSSGWERRRPDSDRDGPRKWGGPRRSYGSQDSPAASPL
jgi:hypothetical protein